MRVSLLACLNCPADLGGNCSNMELVVLHDSRVLLSLQFKIGILQDHINLDFFFITILDFFFLFGGLIIDCL